jgi:hypothetical protein
MLHQSSFLPPFQVHTVLDLFGDETEEEKAAADEREAAKKAAAGAKKKESKCLLGLF